MTAPPPPVDRPGFVNAVEALMAGAERDGYYMTRGVIVARDAVDFVSYVYPVIADALARRLKAEADECHKTMGGGFPAGLESAAEMLHDLAAARGVSE